MSAPPLAPSVHLPELRPWLPVLLPFTALGLLPWWTCLTLSAALALGRLSEDARSVGALIVLLAAALVSGPLLLGGAPDRLLHSGTLFAQAAGVGLLALLSLRLLESGQRRGLLLPVLGLLLVPSAGGLVALLLSALGLSGADGRPGLGLGQSSRGRTLALLLGTALLLGGVGLLLDQFVPPPAPGVRPSSTAARPSDAAHTTPAPATRPAGNTAPLQVQPPQATRFSPDEQGLFLRPLVLLTGLLIVICILLLLQRTRTERARRRSTWADVLAVLGLLTSLGMVGVLGAGAGPGGFLGSSGTSALPAGGRGGAGAGPAVLAPSHPWLALLLNAAIVFATLFFAAAAVLLYLTLRAAQRAGPDTPAAPGGLPDPDRPLPPLHRVRQAWRDLETVLAGADLARQPSETPEEYAARLADRLPGSGADLHTLTRLYLPVRYGGDLSEADADRAEASARNIQGALREWNAAT